ncbi:MAG: molybdenum cofactor biosynthesis protein A [Pelotomaculum sp. PtaB.Bin104]|nr:MAG: molybdenum cofactor biosynthesis protein A [Pelotomaculum sp. PtaB.Bin104]
MYRLLFAGDDGQLYDHPVLRATGRTGDRFVELSGEDMEKLPAGASMVLVPGGVPVGMTRAGNFSALEHNPWTGERSWAVGALLPQGYTRTYLPAYTRSEKEKPLPLLGYTAVACRAGELYAAVRRTDNPEQWDPAHYDTIDLPQLVKNKLDLFPKNPILSHLAHCALEYHCFTAQNIFYGRWEGGLPVSPACNARCLGCISLQPAGCCPSPQARIGFSPNALEVAEVAVPHLNSGAEAIISFGQGCEGEPSLAAATITDAIEMIRAETSRGTINMNSNGGNSAGVIEICRAGLDAVRVSMISAREDIYNAYYRPQGYTLAEVCQSLEAAGRLNVYTSLNLLVFPGLTDRAAEVAALVNLIVETGVKMVQLRNLNIDPDLLNQHLPGTEEELIGIPGLIESLQKVPGLKVGNFSHPVN